MPRKTEATFEIDYVHILDEDGAVDKKLMPSIPKAKILKMYKTMVYARLFDTKAPSKISGRISFSIYGRRVERENGDCSH